MKCVKSEHTFFKKCQEHWHKIFYIAHSRSLAHCKRPNTAQRVLQQNKI